MPARPPAPIPVASSARSTLGVEWELLLVDRDSGESRQCASAVLDGVRAASDRAAPDGPERPRVVGELLQNTVELVTGVCGTVAEAGDDLERSLERVREVADALRVDLTSAGAHPFSRWEDQVVTDAGRYSTLIDRTQWWGRQMTIYGTHVHVGIEDRTKMLPLLNALLTEAGSLLALSAASPCWQGVDTRYASHRSLLFQQLPTAGLPQPFREWQEYERYVADMLAMGAIDELSEIRWDIRPVPAFGTIEVRVADGMPTLREVLGIAALTQCLVEDFSTRLDAGEELPALAPWQVAENKWRAARYGMDAIVVVDARNREELVSDHVRALLCRLEPVAHRLGCAEELAGLTEILGVGASYQRQLAAGMRAAAGPDAAAGVDGRAIVRHLVRETRENRLLAPPA